MIPSNTSNGRPIQMFFGESVVAKKVLVYDWSQTPYGPLSEWSYPLTSSLHFCYSSPFPTFVLWGEDLLLFYNDASEELFKNSVFEFCLNTSARTLWEPIWAKVTKTIDYVLKTGCSKQSKTFNISLSKENPEEYTEVLFTCNAILDQKNKVLGILGHFIVNDHKLMGTIFDKLSEDVDEVAEELAAVLPTQEHLILEKVEAENKNYMNNLFLAALSHELRSPLTSILSWVQILMKGNLSQERECMGLEAIEASAQAQNIIINDLIDFSSVILGKMTINFERTNLIEALVKSINSIVPIAEEKGITIETSLKHDSILVNADPIRLQQIFWNLISNAVKFTALNGHLKIDVSIEKKANAEQVVIFFIDDGIGIKPHLLKYIFELYNQADVSFKKFDGLGIGLSMVANLVRLHKGSVSVSSEGQGKGAIFKVTLPLYE